MGTFSIWHWIILIFVIAVPFWGHVRIVGRTGREWPIAILFYIPIIGGLFLLWFSYTEWPAIDRAGTQSAFD